MTSDPDLPYELRQGAAVISDRPGLDWLRDALRRAADELEEWRAVDHNPPPFDENGVLNDTDARAQDDRRESLLRAIHDITRPEYPPENAAMIVAETHRLTGDLLKVPDSTKPHSPLDPPKVSDELRSKLAAKAQHKLELNRRGWDYDEARGGFTRIALQPLEAGATDIPPDPLPWPLVPMREQYDSDEAYTRAMVAWAKAVHEIEEARNA